MWAKRFPVPQFNRHSLKNMDWVAPPIQSLGELNETGCIAVDGSQNLYDKLSFRGDHLLAVACKLPEGETKITGNSFAWPIQRVAIVDSLDADVANIVADWRTPRPMNTRLGPDDGIVTSNSLVFVLIGHQISDYWVANRIMLDMNWRNESNDGFRILSSCEEDINDFHDAVVYFEWK